jgi:uncharacterized protein involved in outer membrane biogenesis
MTEAEGGRPFLPVPGPIARKNNSGDSISLYYPADAVQKWGYIKMSRKIIIGLGIAALVAIVVVVVGTVWINSFLHSEAFRQKVEAQASEVLGGTVEIKQIDLSIFSGVEVTGLMTKLSSPHGNLVMQVEAVKCSYAFSELLHERLHLTSIAIEKPQITVTPPPTPSLTAPQAPATAPALPAAPLSNKVGAFDVTLDLAKVVDGELTVQDDTGATKAELTGLAMKADTSGFFKGEDVTGTLTIATVALPDNLKVTDFSTPFTYGKETLAAGPFQMSAFTGQINGDYKLNPSGPSLLDLSATKLDMTQLGQAATPNSPTKMSGLLDLQSKWNYVETGKPTGEGDLQISNGKLEGVDILHDLATAFNLPEMSDPVITSVTTHFQVANGTTHFDNLKLISTTFEMSGKGTIDPAGNLSADMVLTLHADAFSRIPPIATGFFTKLPDGGGSIPYKLSGTVQKPLSDLTTQIFVNGSKIHKSIQKTFDKLFK